ncbi:MAG: hypothetical protein Q8M92_09620, partial [Candidatus Subteraquimicrobiales bacterium]|nr:hypothetical protein [Candidatus Subteraquimicrobiales bacterium]
MLGKLLKQIKLIKNKEADIYIANVAHYWKPLSVKPNEWGGKNYKYKALPGQTVLAMKETTDGYATMWDEITVFSVHTRIPEYLVTVNGSYSVRCSPKNSVLVKDGAEYRRSNLLKEYIVGMLTPILSPEGEIMDGIISDVFCTGKVKPMYDLSLANTTIFLADNFLFVYDTVSVHVPVSHKAVNESINMMPSRNLYGEVFNKIQGFPDHSSAVGLYNLSKTPEGR